MKTLTKPLLGAVLGVVFSAAAIAGPGPQFWNRPATKPAAPTETVQTAAPADNSGLTCKRMLVPRVGPPKQAPYLWVECTSEMMRNDWRCQQACAKAKKG